MINYDDIRKDRQRDLLKDHLDSLQVRELLEIVLESNVDLTEYLINIILDEGLIFVSRSGDIEYNV